jgi:hypothetical protein
VLVCCAARDRLRTHSSGSQPGRLCIAALFAPRKAAVGGRNVVAWWERPGHLLSLAPRPSAHELGWSGRRFPDRDVEGSASLPCSLRARQLREVVTSLRGREHLGEESLDGVRDHRRCQYGVSPHGNGPDRDVEDSASLPCSLRARQLWEAATLSRGESAWVMHASGMLESICGNSMVVLATVWHYHR